MAELLAARYVYLLVLVLLAIGLYGMLASSNLAKKIVGMVIFQTAIYLFFIEGSVREGATLPIIDPALGSDPVHYVNPLPHLLILTAIVVGVAILGVALTFIIRIYQAHGSLEEDRVITKLTGRDPQVPENSGDGS